MEGERQRLVAPTAPYGTYGDDSTVEVTAPASRCHRCMALFNCTNGLTIFPIALIILFPVTFFTSYLIAVLLGHVAPDFPYISDTGTQSPESCIFGQLLNICSVLALINIYLKYRHVSEYYQFGNRHLMRANIFCLILGILSSLGASIVANFQLTSFESNVLTVHMIGAMLAFGVGTVYCWIMCWITSRIQPFGDSKGLLIARICLSALSTVSFVMTFIFAALARKNYHGSDRKKWHPSDGGFVFHVLSTASEWIMAAAILAYFGTFIADFRKLGARPLQVFIIDDEEVDFISRAQDSERLGDEVA